jgi:hypothetical protein
LASTASLPFKAVIGSLEDRISTHLQVAKSISYKSTCLNFWQDLILALASLVKTILGPLLATPSLVAPGSLVDISKAFTLATNKKACEDIRNNCYKCIECKKLIGQEAKL